MQKIVEKLSTELQTVDPLRITYNLKRRPGYVQAFLILQDCSDGDNHDTKVYQICRRLGFDYYQGQKRVMELAEKGFVRIVNGRVTVTETGIQLREILAKVGKSHCNDA